MQSRNDADVGELLEQMMAKIQLPRLMEVRVDHQEHQRGRTQEQFMMLGDKSCCITEHVAENKDQRTFQNPAVCDLYTSDVC